MKSYLFALKERLDGYIYHSGMSDADYLSKRVALYWCIYTCSGTVFLTYLGYYLELTHIFWYGCCLLFMFVVSFILFGTNLDFRKSFYPQLYAYEFISCLFIGLLGGIMHSGGLIFCALNTVILSVVLRSLKMTVGLVAFFLSALLTLVVLSPFLSVPPEMTEKANQLYFTMNLIWLTTSQIIFAVFFYLEIVHYENREQERLRELDETKTRLFTSITHEFRTPITLITGLANQIHPPDLKSKQGLEIIRNSAAKLLRLVNQVLSLAKLDSGLMQLHTIQSDLVQFIHSITDSFKPLFEKNSIQFSISAHPKFMQMDFDPEKMEEVIHNLLSNALRFTPAGGKIEVKINAREEEKASKVTIEVRDTGVGIPAEKLDKIWDRYYQVEQTTKYHQEGTGLGLTLVKEQVKLMGGSIQVKSMEGLGSIFILTLPVTHTAPQKIHTPTLIPVHSTPEPAKEKLAKIEEVPQLLIVEDQPDMVYYIGSFLENEYQISVAGNGKQGLEMAIEQIPDIIISDVMMPGMDGFDLLQHLKTDIRTNHIPVLLLTALADHPSKMEGIAYGAEVYLTKPFKEEELRLRMRKILEQRKILQQRYLSTNMSEMNAVPQFVLEDRFIQAIHHALELHIDDDRFGVDELAHSMAMSRTQLYRKFKALTNDPVDKYIRKFRLHQALQLFKTTDLNVSQVALEVGIPNPAYFSRIFRQEFGHTPSEFKEGLASKSSKIHDI